MNAEEARNKALENSKNEIEEIKGYIEEAVNSGETHIILIRRNIKDGTRKWLEDNGYEWFHFNLYKNNSTGRIVECDTKIKW